MRAPWYRSGPRHVRSGWRSQQPQRQQLQEGAAFDSTALSTSQVQALLPCIAMHACIEACCINPELPLRHDVAYIAEAVFNC